MVWKLGKLLAALTRGKTRERQVREVLKAFRHMGANDQDIEREKARLKEDDGYLIEWYSEVRRKA